mmetsp:Transcript_24209/g.39771  ORF Transcript_24209/g.39771 Transcript_24209/m.39771 type:complete len:206 (-) Transcript_24209:207-824(-)|eukprot:CAMPEP_0184644192 /NCGR_PEP_ID=MMETSP0308-20130426/957_1 /TAXON_ID=38269 /ORGANISM="Gloeochaete witrockiana, Strain SAG 46.84" /LENGTH=205 /DNA_ID=CAMNT_0027072591 /DNA_START=123 /DNA_END=740 /DNA_ORIENTATION=+
MSVILHNYWRSSSSWRVRIVLSYKNIPYEYLAVNLLSPERDEDFKKISPLAQVPVLQIDGVALTQSSAICEYIEETRPDPPLLPKDPVSRARVREIVAIINSAIQPLHNNTVLQRIAQDKKADWLHKYVFENVQGLERLIETTGGKYCVGDEVTLADAFLVPQLAAARRLDVDVSAFPSLLRIEAALADLPAFIAAHANVQPDAK